jgi:hypothetical protein
MNPVAGVRSMGREQRQFDYFLVSYVPALLDEDEYIFAVLGFERVNNEPARAVARFDDIVGGPYEFDAAADIDFLLEFRRDVEQQFQDRTTAEHFLQLMLDGFSNTIRISGPISVALIDDLDKEMDEICEKHFVSNRRANLRIAI